MPRGISSSRKASKFEQSLAKSCWNKCRKESILALQTPFVMALASGNLELNTFGNYAFQDLHFLKCFVEALRLAEECADDHDDKIPIRKLRKDIHGEFELQDSFVKEFVLNCTKEYTVNPASVKYTDFVLETASGKVKGVAGKMATPFEKSKLAAYTLAAITPCMSLYAFIGKEVRSLLDTGGSSHQYKQCINYYSSKRYKEFTRRTEVLLDKLSVSLTGEELEFIGNLYHQAMILLKDFFSAQLIVQKTVVPLLKDHNPSENRLIVFSDFDKTCTVVESSAVLAEISIVRAPKSDQADMRNAWKKISKEYREEHKKCVNKLLLAEKAKKFNYRAVKKTLEQVSEFEKMANTIVIESGLLEGLNLEDIKRAGERLPFQEGCICFFQSITKNENISASIHVLSFCWCKEFMKSAFSTGELDTRNIHANEFIYDGSSISTGEMVRKVESPIDKAKLFGKILQKSGSDKASLVVFIGHSVGDLLCLLEADIGIVINSSESLRRVGSHFGVSFVPLFSGLVKKQKEMDKGRACSWNNGLSGTLYTVSSWAEIRCLILGF